VAAGRFREDLFYRLNVIPMTLPALRDRREDIPILTRHFLGRFSLKYNRQELELTPEHETLLENYDWPGNIRELQNVIERAVLLSIDGKIHLDLPSARTAAANHPFDDLPDLDEIQRRYILYIMDKTGGKMSGPGGAAELLGMKRTSLYNRMKKLGMR
jgi:DNA-binding NtrC family response regulator